MKTPSVSIFVLKRGNHWLARSYAHDAIDDVSANRAAIKCGARHFDVPESAIRLIPDENGAVVAFVAGPEAKPQGSERRLLWSALAIALLVDVLLFVALIWEGGAR